MLNESGPAVILGNAKSIFVRQLAEYWRDCGLNVAIVTERACFPAVVPTGIQLVDSHQFRRRSLRWLRAGNPMLRLLEREVPRFRLKHYQQATGRHNSDAWEKFWVDNFLDSFCRSRAALSLRPRFVFGQEATSYGLATALCRGVPRVLFPWGGDIFNCVEVSPVLDWMATAALRNVDLIVPSSNVAADYIPLRFGVDPSKVAPISWGVDTDLFRPADSVRREATLRTLGIPSGSRVIVNARRFRAFWGAETVLNACLKVVASLPDAHAVFPGGAGTEDEIRRGRDLAAQSGCGDRITFLDGDLPLNLYADMLSVADVFVSLMGRGDMRSSSVLQGAACGGAPVLAESLEYRSMTENGFRAKFVALGDVDQLERTLRELLVDDAGRELMRKSNRQYIERHENRDAQMRALSSAVESVCARYGLL